MFFDWHSAFLSFLAIAWAIYLAVLVVWVLLQKRPPEATISWILTLAFLPYIGFLVFYVFGPKRLTKQRLRYPAALYGSDDLQTLKERTANTPIRLRQLARLGITSTGIYPCTARSVQLLDSGAATFDAIFAAIEQASSHIHLQYYIFEPDQTGTRLRDLLIAKSLEGVEVRLLVDALGSKRLGRVFLQPLLEAGVQFARFHDTRLWRRWRPVINYRTHRKIVVCDGVVAFTGGVNITDEEDLRIDPKGYHDVHVRLEGNPAFWLQMVFLEDWSYANGCQIDDCLGDLHDYLPVSEVGRYDVQVLTSGPNNATEAIHRSYIKAISDARKRILLTTPYFVPSAAAMMALTTAALAGVDVHVMVPKKSDSILVTLAARSYFDELIDAGVTVWEYNDRMLHSKTLVVDGHYGFIGTANFDIRSFRLNYEVGVSVFGAEFNQTLAMQFQKDMLSACKLPPGRRPGFAERLAEAVARLFSPML